MSPLARENVAGTDPADLHPPPNSRDILLERRAVARLEVGVLALAVGDGEVLQDPHATIPPEDRFVVARRPDLLGLLEPFERVLEEDDQRVRGTAGRELCFREPLAHDAGVIEPLVGIPELLEDPLRLRAAVRRR